MKPDNLAIMDQGLEPITSDGGVGHGVLEPQPTWFDMSRLFTLSKIKGHKKSAKILTASKFEKL